MGKNIEDLEKSRKIRKNALDKFGEVPTSIWRPNYSIGKTIIEFDERKQQYKAEEKHKNMEYGDKLSLTEKKKQPTKHEFVKIFGMSSQNVRGKSAGLSTFPPDLAKRIVEFYSSKYETILDPCAGHNSRMQVTFQLDRNYIGYDICHEFMDFNRRVKKIILGEAEQTLLFDSKVKIILREQSSEKLVEQNNTIDMIYTSPPYWDIEYYDDSPKQLGYKKTYSEFLGALKQVIFECYRVLKPQKFCIFNINDFRKNNLYYMYHSDVANIMKDVGFKLWDIIIIEWQSSIGACFASQVVERKITAKKHEYLVVGKKC